ncbi:MAG TPA: hypothetical protein VKX16_10875, partial [Chloroflexota bacterium]|nr:hypothetical protein [Chloroflexota bacterium]
GKPMDAAVESGKSRRTVGSREGAKEIVESAILLDHDDDVPNLSAATGARAGAGARLRSATRWDEGCAQADCQGDGDQQEGARKDGSA